MYEYAVRDAGLYWYSGTCTRYRCGTQSMAPLRSRHSVSVTATRKLQRASLSAFAQNMAQQRKVAQEVVKELAEKRGELDCHEHYHVEEKFFGQNPLEFFEDVGHIVDMYISDCADEIVNFMKQGRVRPELADRGADQFVRFVMKAYDPNIDRFSMYCLRNLFTVPYDLQLPLEALETTADANRAGTSDAETNLDGDIADLHARVRALKSEGQLLKKQCAALDSSASTFEKGADALLRSTEAFERHGIANIGESMARLMENFNEAHSLEKRANAISERLEAGPGAASSDSRTMFRPRVERVRDADALACGFRAHKAAMGSRTIAQLEGLKSSLGVC